MHATPLIYISLQHDIVFHCNPGMEALRLIGSRLALLLGCALTPHSVRSLFQVTTAVLKKSSYLIALL